MNISYEDKTKNELYEHPGLIASLVAVVGKEGGGGR